MLFHGNLAFPPALYFYPFARTKVSQSAFQQPFVPVFLSIRAPNAALHGNLCTAVVTPIVLQVQKLCDNKTDCRPPLHTTQNPSASCDAELYLRGCWSGST